jgi:hypothetical protein
MIIKAITKAICDKEKKGWDKIYFAIDIHDTMIKANYQAGNIPTEFFPDAIVALQELTKRDDIKLILYTCSHPHEIEQYHQLFEANDIKFDFVNENPDVKTDNQGYGNYDKKPYFNVILDDKAGFDPIIDWPIIIKLLNPFNDFLGFPLEGKETESAEWLKQRLT